MKVTQCKRHLHADFQDHPKQAGPNVSIVSPGRRSETGPACPAGSSSDWPAGTPAERGQDSFVCNAVVAHYAFKAHAIPQLRHYAFKAHAIPQL
eukprot:360465-Chlamydomonas_euryale.AAC.13